LTSDHLSKTGKNVTVFLDLKAAYDRVPHRRLLNKLEARGCPPRILSLIYHLMCHETTSILTCNRELSKLHIIRSRGLFQGSILSPLLFNIFIDDLAVDDRRLLFYAGKYESSVEAQISIDRCQTWATSNGMEFNVKKCGVVGTRDPIRLGSNVIPAVDSYKYLGCPHTGKGIDWRLYLTSKLEQQERLLMGFMNARRTWPWPTRLIIYKTFIYSTMQYAMGLWALWLDRQEKKVKKEFIKRIEKVHRLSLEFITFKGERSINVLSSITDIGTVEYRLAAAKASLARHVDGLNPENPLYQYIRRPKLLPERDYVLSSINGSKLYRRYVQQGGGIWKEFLQAERFQDYLTSDGVLQHYVLPSGRTLNGHDQLLRYENPSPCVLWRIGRYLTHRKCICGDKFNRRHVIDCHLLDAYISEEDQELMEMDRELVSRTLQLANKQEQGIYTFLDFLLNHARHEEFGRVLDALTRLLT
jgi:hypothetical protein